MKLIQLHIENFGTLHDFDLSMQDGLNDICKQNGFGKTTLATFIKAMFYGMAKKGNNKAYASERSKFKPWQGGVYGGYICFETKLGKFKAIRTFADTPEGDTFELVDLATGLKTDKYSKNLGYDIFHVGVETFEITAFFPQLDLMSSLNDEVRASLTGANKFENDLARFAAAQKIISERMRELKKQVLPKTELEKLNSACHSLETRILTLQEEISNRTKSIEEDTIKQEEIEKTFKVLAKRREEIARYNQEKAELEKEIMNLQDKISQLFTFNLENSAQNVSNKPKSGLNSAIGVGVISFIIMCTLLILGALNVIGWVVTAPLCAVDVMLGGVVCILLMKPQKQTNESMPLQETFTILDKQLNSKKSELKLSYSQTKNFDEEKFSQLQNQKFEIEKHISINEVTRENIERELESVSEQLEQYESNLTSRQFESVKASENLKLLEKTLTLMKQAQENVSVRFIEPMQQGFEKYFSKISSKPIKLDINFDAKLQTGTMEREFEYLSQGYRDVVSVCKRLALIENIYQEESPFIIMDDPFVNLDNQNFAQVRQILLDFSKKYQIVYLNCHEQRKV